MESNFTGEEFRSIHWHNVLEAYMTGRPLKGKITETDRNGATVDLGGLSAFIPTKLLLIHGETPAMMRDREVEAIVVKASALSGNILMSRSDLFRDEDLRKRQEEYSSLSLSKIYTGKVKSVMPYGVFVELERLCGMIPIKELSWDYVEDPAAIAKPGDPIEVKVLSADAPGKRIVLSRKQAMPNPWLSCGSKIKQGDIAECEVKGIWATGIFVKMPQGICGMVKAADMPGGKPPESAREGGTIKVQVVEIDSEKEILRLAIK